MNDAEWTRLMAEVRSTDLHRASAAMAKLKRDASEGDIPRLVALLDDESFVVREAAAWPLSDLGAVAALPALLRAHRLGSSEGYDNDGLTAALIDLVEARPTEALELLKRLQVEGDEEIRELATWLLEFCHADDA